MTVFTILVSVIHSPAHQEQFGRQGLSTAMRCRKYGLPVTFPLEPQAGDWGGGKGIGNLRQGVQTIKDESIESVADDEGKHQNRPHGGWSPRQQESIEAWPKN